MRCTCHYFMRPSILERTRCNCLPASLAYSKALHAPPFLCVGLPIALQWTPEHAWVGSGGESKEECGTEEPYLQAPLNHCSMLLSECLMPLRHTKKWVAWTSVYKHMCFFWYLIFVLDWYSCVQQIAKGELIHSHNQMNSGTRWLGLFNFWCE